MSFVDAHDFPPVRTTGPEHRGPDLLRLARRRANPSQRQLDDAVLLEQIVKIRSVSEFATTYGSRVWRVRRQGVHVGRKRALGSCAST
uniref:hypothetical protein n=1 Tax=Pseudonocardia sp. ICBG1293 TaxID=2844382 RepID=UPI001CCCC22A